MLHRLLATAAAIALLATSAGTTPAAHAADEARGRDLADQVAEDASRATGVGNAGGATVLGPSGTRSWMLRFDEDATPAQVAAAAGAATARGATVGPQWGSAVQGFHLQAGHRVIDDLVGMPGLAMVEADDPVTLATVQEPATWGLDRIDQRDLPLDGRFATGGDGTGVRIYVIDSGIRPSHDEFVGRVLTDEAVWTVDDGETYLDCNGHGTHVAGTAAGTTYGVAQDALIVPYRVVDCDGDASESDIVAALDHIAAHVALPAVVNMSLTGPPSPIVDSATQAVIDAGATVVTAAGNEDADACNYSPGANPSAINVGSTSATDGRSFFSNWGGCIDLFAPGSQITSAWSTSDTQTRTLDGTSMAAPHVAGVAALALEQTPTASPAEIAERLTSTATTNRISDEAGSPDLLLHAGLEGGDDTVEESPPPPPDACSEHANVFTGSLGEGQVRLLPPVGDYVTDRLQLHTGCLESAAGTDFDLALLTYDTATDSYDVIARSETTTNLESISQQLGAGRFAWGVHASSGSGTFQMGFTLEDVATPGHERFIDVALDDIFTAAIGELAAAGITRGCNPPANDRFCPDDPVTRGQMAAFLVRALDLPADGTDRFDDDDGTTFEPVIQALAAAGITRGCNPPTNNRFCPDDPVTRGQMAAFLVRALDLPADGTDRFDDDDGTTFEPVIQALAAAGITRGCNPPTNNRFCPDDPVTRGQMAAFLVRAGVTD